MRPPQRWARRCKAVGLLLSRAVAMQGCCHIGCYIGLLLGDATSSKMGAEMQGPMAPIAIAMRSRFSGLTSLDTTLSSSKMVEGSTNWLVDRHLLIHTGTHGHASKYPRTCYGWASQPDRYGLNTHTHTNTHCSEKNKGAGTLLHVDMRALTWPC